MNPTTDKVDKRTKEYKALTYSDKISVISADEVFAEVEAKFSVLTLIEMGIPLSLAIFHDTVLSYGGTTVNGEPEFALYDPTSKSKPSRTAKLWYTPHGVVVKQREVYKILPLAALKDSRVL